MRLENKDVDTIKGVITQLLDEFKGELLCNIREVMVLLIEKTEDNLEIFNYCFVK